MTASAAYAQQSLGIGANPAVDVGADGSSVLVWEWVDSDGAGVFAQRYDSIGMPLGSTFRVNTVETSAQQAPDVALLAGGSFVVVWESLDGAKPQVLGQLFDSIGMPLGSQFAISGSTGGRFPMVDDAPGGAFVVAWAGLKPGGGNDADDDARGFRAEARRFDSIGMPLGSSIRVSGNAGAGAPAVAVSPDGSFLVSWTTKQEDLRSRLFDPIGMPLGSTFRVSDSRAGAQRDPAATVTPDGEYLVVWEREQGANRDVFARLIDIHGMPLGSSLQINQTPSEAPTTPDVAVDGDSQVMATWHCFEAPVPGHANVIARLIDIHGMPLGSELRLNVDSTGVHRRPGVAGEPGEGFVVVWEREDQTGTTTIEGGEIDP